jgi:hypothetical protein
VTDEELENLKAVCQAALGTKVGDDYVFSWPEEQAFQQAFTPMVALALLTRIEQLRAWSRALTKHANGLIDMDELYAIRDEIGRGEYR